MCQYELAELEWTTCEEVFRILHPFAVVTQHFGGFKYPTLSCVVSLYNTLLDMLDDYLKDSQISDTMKSAAQAPKGKLNKYYYKTAPVHLAAAILDQRSKIALLRIPRMK